MGSHNSWKIRGKTGEEPVERLRISAGRSVDFPVADGSIKPEKPKFCGSPEQGRPLRQDRMTGIRIARYEGFLS